MHILSASFTNFSGVGSAHGRPSLKIKSLLIHKYASEIINRNEVSKHPSLHPMYDGQGTAEQGEVTQSDWPISHWWSAASGYVYIV